MDCSGTIHYLLSTMQQDVPRQADEFYKWVWEQGKFVEVNSMHYPSYEFSKLRPGDLLFWTGTYAVHRDSPVSHIMLYLGTSHNKPIMFGASDGRTYQNKKMWGVSVFDFVLPKQGSRARFIGYSCIPNLTCANG